MSGKAPPGIAMFDSASAMARALGRVLHGGDFSAVGQPRWQARLASYSDILPTRIRDLIFAAGGPFESVRPDRLDRVDAEAIARWMAQLYPRSRYAAAMIGSSNGALVHLCAAAGVAWLPQTFLTLVRQSHPDPDDAVAAMEQGLGIGERLLEANPGVTVHHMHDPNQDRRMLHYISYFRMKHRRLPGAYRKFLIECLEPGGTLYIVDCRRRWPLTRASDRQVFQFGAVGGADREDYFKGGEETERYFRRLGKDRGRWDPPPPNTEDVEAEWGYEAALGSDLQELAAERGIRLVRLVFDDPEDISPLVADAFRSWYGEHGIEARRLLVPSFILMDPHWTIRTGSVPFWMVFNVASSQERIRRYLAEAGPFDAIRMMLFSNGAIALGQGSIESWRSILDQARTSGEFLGVNEQAYPHDLATLANYHRALKALRPHIEPPPPLSLGRAEDLIRTRGGDYGVELCEMRSVEGRPA